MENKFPSDLLFTFEMKAPKIDKEKWAAFLPRMEIDLPQIFSISKRKLPKLFKKMASTSPRMEIDLPQIIFHF